MNNKFILPAIPTAKKWYRCPNCGKNLFIFNNTAKCSGVFLRCKNCKKEIEIRI